MPRRSPAPVPDFSPSRGESSGVAGFPLLREAKAAVTPSQAARRRVRASVQRRIAAPAVLFSARRALTPSATRREQIWLRIQSLFGTPISPSLWGRLREGLDPSASISRQLWQRIVPRLAAEPAMAPATRPSYRMLKLVSAFAVLLLVVRASPFLFLAPPTIAESSVTVLLTRGKADVLRGELWHPLQGETTLSQEATIRTENGEVTISLHDDAVIRLGPNTTVTLHDLTDRPTNADVGTTLSLRDGQVWVLGLLPRPLDAVRIGTSQAHVEVQEGSISIRQGNGSVDIDAWDRSATIVRRGKRLPLLAGEHFAVREGQSFVSRLDTARYQESWASGNLTRDAVHRREIAQLQQERRAAGAGILPDSTLYPAKRLAEAVDVLFTFTPEARAKKLVAQANTRLNEAAALISRGSGSDAVSVLQEYQETLLAAASGSGGNAVVQTLIREEVIEKATADTAAALPNNDAYVLKEAVREAISQLPETGEVPEDIRAAQLLDRLSSVREQVTQGGTESINVAEVTSLLRESESSGELPKDVLDEVRANLSTIIAVTQSEENTPAAAESASSSSERSRIRERGEPSRRPPLTDEQVEQKAQEIVARIFIFQGRESRRNTFFDEMRALESNPDKGRILRRLEQKNLPAGFLNLLAHEKQKLHDETRAELERQAQEGSGAVLP